MSAVYRRESLCINNAHLAICLYLIQQISKNDTVVEDKGSGSTASQGSKRRRCNCPCEVHDEFDEDEDQDAEPTLEEMDAIEDAANKNAMRVYKAMRILTLAFGP